MAVDYEKPIDKAFYFCQVVFNKRENSLGKLRLRVKKQRVSKRTLKSVWCPKKASYYQGGGLSACSL